MAKSGMTYADSGVDIDAGNQMVGLIKQHLARTHGPRVISQHGAFAGCFRLDYNERLFKRNFRDPVLLACTDSVGSKVKIAIDLGILDTVGQDVVAMNVNDLIVQGAEPLFFLDYIGTHKLSPDQMTRIVKGVADGCEIAGCALLGGETAELPDLYAPGDFDLAGFAVGVCELKRMVNPEKVAPGDIVLGLASSGIHSNGYSLVRAIVKQANLNLDEVHEDCDPTRTLGRALLEPTRIYAKSIITILHRYRVKRVVSGMAHITGGGMAENLNRALPEDLDAHVQLDSWEIPPVFNFLAKHGNVDPAEMRRVFNMGIGYCLIVRPTFAQSIARQLRRAGETVYQIGKIVPGTGKVIEN
ncbi:MAG: phosphoribosylformylglycinamidine cyclo-ligase [Planctomycetaceae bacterium]|nr:phosphoribosylformylglycinamidine cyclo-ligase [Planctomycetaceae bacterium]